MSNGYFVDLASNHYSEGSNTIMLELYNNWRGICIEPNPMYWQDLLARRKCELFISPVSSAAGTIVDFQFRTDHRAGNSGIVNDAFDNTDHTDKDIKRLVTTTLTHILDYMGAPPVIQYLSLDVEGAELLALQSLDHSRYTFMVVSIERPTPACHKFMNENGYRYIITLGRFGETMYVHKDIPNFVDLMKRYRNNNVPDWNDKDVLEKHRGKKPYIVHPSYHGGAT